MMQEPIMDKYYNNSELVQKGIYIHDGEYSKVFPAPQLVVLNNMLRIITKAANDKEKYGDDIPTLLRNAFEYTDTFEEPFYTYYLLRLIPWSILRPTDPESERILKSVDVKFTGYTNFIWNQQWLQSME